MAVKLKTPEQIEGIRKSCHLSRNTLKYIREYVQPGTTTDFLDKKIEEYIRDHGAVPATLNYRGYPRSSCISVNDEVCHGIPGHYTLRDGDITSVDVSTILNGYVGDTCMMYPIGEISPEAQRLLSITEECLDLGIRQCYPGGKIGNIGHAIGSHAKGNGYSVVYEFCGHGLGLSLHEEPEVSHIADANTGITLRPGMTFTIEPMINQGKARVKVDKKDKWTARTIDEKLSAQYEHAVLITQDGVDVLTDIDGEYNGKGERVRRVSWFVV
ncbi:MAG: type I methionyl aminopeptidase [Bacteroidota bacterium]|nr:type I methionyl aminopeptidase [Bacteroidota bacterium]